MPAELVVFDVLLWDGEPVHELALEERRTRRRGARTASASRRRRATRLSRAAGSRRSRRRASTASSRKRLGLPYLPGSREGVVKVKERKTADCVVVGVRWKAKPTQLATLLLGLYREDGGLDYVGSAAVGARRHAEMFAAVEPLLEGAPDRGFSEPNRWGGGELAESALRPELVAEVQFDKVQGNRFRHGTKFIRFREDKEPEQCTWREVRPPRRPGRPDLRVAARSLARRRPRATRRSSVATRVLVEPRRAALPIRRDERRSSSRAAPTSARSRRRCR